MISFKNYHIGLFVLFLIICSSRPTLSANKCHKGDWTTAPMECDSGADHTHCTIDKEGKATGCVKGADAPGCKDANVVDENLVCEQDKAKDNGCCCKAGTTPCNTKDAFCKMDKQGTWDPRVLEPTCPPPPAKTCLNANGEKDTCATDKTQYCIIDANGIPGGCADDSHAACNGLQGAFQCTAGVGCCCDPAKAKPSCQDELVNYCDKFVDDGTFAMNKNHLLNLCPRPTYCQLDDGEKMCRFRDRYCVVSPDGFPDGCTNDLHQACRDEDGPIEGYGSSIMCLQPTYVDNGCCCEADANGTICNTKAKWDAFCKENGNDYLPICKEYGALPATGAILTVPRILLFVASLITVAISFC